MDWGHFFTIMGQALIIAVVSITCVFVGSAVIYVIYEAITGRKNK